MSHIYRLPFQSVVLEIEPGWLVRLVQLRIGHSPSLILIKDSIVLLKGSTLVELAGSWSNQ